MIAAWPVSQHVGFFFLLLLFREGWGGCLVSFIPNICSRLLINQNQKLLVV